MLLMSEYYTKKQRKIKIVGAEFNIVKVPTINMIRDGRTKSSCPNTLLPIRCFTNAPNALSWIFISYRRRYKTE
ncbi:hypothetical protein I3842_08G088500 [Carya illinoinensis]|uniref:Uncharacterized protein n=1 Tax=Carya illinoinensis TaxID=32201 RepID=A0A922JCZ1_CARIL|nr:hypothetical protein I3842_08G088500 [Carya illinoinensis]